MRPRRSLMYTPYIEAKEYMAKTRFIHFGFPCCCALCGDLNPFGNTCLTLTLILVFRKYSSYTSQPSSRSDPVFPSR